MIQRNKNNSIIFLTTLSVYLGLVLVGGVASPVLAQQAQKLLENTATKTETCKSAFPQIKEEIDSSTIIYFMKDFLSDLKGLARMEKVDISESFYLEFAFRIAGISQETNVSKPNNINKWLFLACEDAAEELKSFEIYQFHYKRFGQFSRYDDKFKGFAAHSSVIFENNESNLTIKVKFEQASNDKAQEIAAFYNSVFSFGSCEYKGKFLGTLYQNTTAVSENNQVFIVTRLPRGSLDTLFKQDAKAENQ